MQSEADETAIQPKSRKQSFFEFVRFVAVALLIVVPVRVFLIEPFVVKGPSMLPTFQDRNYLIVDKISYRFNNPKRNDVIIFRPPVNLKTFYIKRIIGLPNETIDVKKNIVTITNKEHPEGFVLDQSFIKNKGGGDAHLELGDDEYFVMGDNRGASSDSRSWGAVKKEFITGKALLRLNLWPIEELVDISPGSYK